MGRSPGKTEKSIRTEEAILEASAFCIGNEGIEQASITRIAERAGVSRALVAHYFPRKEELFEQVIRYVARQGLLLIDGQANAPVTAPSERIRSIASANMEFFMKRRHYYRCFILFYHYASIDSRLRKLNTLFYEGAITRMAGAVGELNPALEPSRKQIWAETLYRSYFFSIERYFVLDHKRSADEWRALALSELDCLISAAQVSRA